MLSNSDGISGCNACCLRGKALEVSFSHIFTHCLVAMTGHLDKDLAAHAKAHDADNEPLSQLGYDLSAMGFDVPKDQARSVCTVVKVCWRRICCVR